MTVLPLRSPEDVEAAIPKVRSHLMAGGLLAYPTETVYGLGCRPITDDVKRLASFKGRASGKPFLLLVSSRAMAESHGLEFTAAARALADRHWPGPLTLVVRGGEKSLPTALRGREGGIAVRWTSHQGMATMIASLGSPITSTSANRPGQSTAAGLGELQASFGAAIDAGTLLVLDGGVIGNAPPSSIVDCTEDRPRLVRLGAIPLEELQANVGGLAQ